MFPASGLHQFFNKRSSTYKDEDGGLWMDVPPNTMESDSATTLVRDSTAIFMDDGLWRTPQRRSNRHASQLASANMKSMYGVDEGGCMSRVPQAPKRQAVGSPEAGDVNAGDPDYAPITLTQSETDDEMQDLCDYAEPSPHSPITVSDEHCDKEQDPSLGPCTVSGARPQVPRLSCSACSLQWSHSFLVTSSLVRSILEYLQGSSHDMH